MKLFKKISSNNLVTPLLQSLDDKPHLWDEITIRQTTLGSPHAHTKAIFLRGPRVIDVHSMFNDTIAIPYPALYELPEAERLIHAVMQQLDVKCLGRAMITKLIPWGKIDAHFDDGLYSDTYDRVHLVLRGDDGNIFSVKEDPHYGEFVSMLSGELWWFNHKKVHFVDNSSNIERIHLIVDIKDWNNAALSLCA